MTTIASIALPAASSWDITIGGGWIIVMLASMALGCVGMLGFMWLFRGGRGFAMCGRRWLQEPPLTLRERATDEGAPRTPLPGDVPGVHSAESEA